MVVNVDVGVHVVIVIVCVVVDVVCGLVVFIGLCWWCVCVLRLWLFVIVGVVGVSVVFSGVGDGWW